jgi:hypothetical protein
MSMRKQNRITYKTLSVKGNMGPGSTPLHRCPVFRGIDIGRDYFQGIFLGEALRSVDELVDTRSGKIFLLTRLVAYRRFSISKALLTRMTGSHNKQ